MIPLTTVSQCIRKHIKAGCECGKGYSTMFIRLHNVPPYKSAVIVALLLYSVVTSSTLFQVIYPQLTTLLIPTRLRCQGHLIILDPDATTKVNIFVQNNRLHWRNLLVARCCRRTNRTMQRRKYGRPFIHLN